MRKILEKIEMFMLWKRFGLHKCDVCHRLSILQYEVGLGYWVCRRKHCSDIARKLYEIDVAIELFENLEKSHENTVSSTVSNESYN